MDKFSAFSIPVREMIDDFEDFLAYLTRLRAEHRELDERLRHIEREWTSGVGEAVARELRELEVLRGELARHFNEEEAGGCLDEAVSRDPSLGDLADRLEREHAELLGQLDRLIATLKGLSQPSQQLDEARAEFCRLAERLHAHEAAENRVLEQSFQIDLE